MKTLKGGKYGHDEILKLLIDKVDVKNPKDIEGVTPLHKAAFGGSEKICEMIHEVVVDNNPKEMKGENHRIALLTGILFFLVR